MAIQDVVVETVKCDNPACTSEAVFPKLQNGVLPEVLEKNPWLKTARLIQTADGRVRYYCTDVCEVAGIKTGEHNPPEPKKVIDMPSGPALEAIKKAAAEELARRQGTQALKEGKQVQFQQV